MCGTYGVGRNVRVVCMGGSLGLGLGQALTNLIHLILQFYKHMKF